MQDFFDPFLGDKYFEDQLISLINEGIILEVMNSIFDEESKKTRTADIRRGIRIFLARTNADSKKKMKEDYLNLKDDKERSIWLFISMGRCFYD